MSCQKKLCGVRIEAMRWVVILTLLAATFLLASHSSNRMHDQQEAEVIAVRDRADQFELLLTTIENQHRASSAMIRDMSQNHQDQQRVLIQHRQWMMKAEDFAKKLSEKTGVPMPENFPPE